MFNYLSSMTQLAPLLFASAATAPPGVPDTTLILTLTYNKQIIKSKLIFFLVLSIYSNFVIKIKAILTEGAF